VPPAEKLRYDRNASELKTDGKWRRGVGQTRVPSVRLRAGLLVPRSDRDCGDCLTFYRAIQSDCREDSTFRTFIPPPEPDLELHEPDRDCDPLRGAFPSDLVDCPLRQDESGASSGIKLKRDA
jgi:hypothetical protein